MAASSSLSCEGDIVEPPQQDEQTSQDKIQLNEEPKIVSFLGSHFYQLAFLALS
jgi:hypothetical protein